MEKMFFVFCLVFLLVGCSKAKIERECLMNGLGSGKCTFTNIDNNNSTDGQCGKVKLYKIENTSYIASSSVFCSGEIKRKTTVEKEFNIYQMDEACQDETRKRFLELMNVDSSSLSAEELTLNLEKMKTFSDELKNSKAKKWNEICFFQFEEVE